MTTRRGYRWKAEGQRLREARERVGLTQEQVAERLGLTWQTVWQWEAGRSRPAPRNLREVAAIYAVSVDHLLGRDTPATTLPFRGLIPEDAAANSPAPTSTPLPEFVVKAHPAAFAMRVQGNSLASEGFHDSELLIVDPASGLEVDKLYIVREEGRLQVRSLATREGRIVLRSTAGSLREVRAHDVDILGRIVWHLRRL